MAEVLEFVDPLDPKGLWAKCAAIAAKDGREPGEVMDEHLAALAKECGVDVKAE